MMNYINALLNIEKALHSWDESILVMVYHYFYIVLIQLVKILMKIFQFHTIIRNGLHLSFHKLFSFV
jgi:hypothetical protein